MAAPIMIEKKVMATRFLRIFSDLKSISRNIRDFVMGNPLSPAMEHLRRMEPGDEPGRHVRTGQGDEDRNGDIHRDDNRAERDRRAEYGEADDLRKPGPGQAAQQPAD